VPLYVIYSTWCERSYLLAVVLSVRGFLQGGGWGRFCLLFRSLALLPVSAYSVCAVFILFSVVFRGGCRLR